jgi:hypothetical protein
MKLLKLFVVGTCSLLVGNAGAGSGANETLSSWCGSNATIEVPAAHLLVCPQGDGQSLAEVGATITVQVFTDQCWPPPGFPPEDIFLYGCDAVWTTLCAPVSQAINADGPTDGNGMTTVSGTIRAGGYGTGLWVMVRGEMATGVCVPSCADPICLPITVVSPDINGDLVVNLVDVALLAGAWPPLPYSPPIDFNGDGVINLLDLSLFAQHLLHSC